MRTILTRILKAMFRCNCAPIVHNHNEFEGYDESAWHDEVGGGDA